MSSMRTANVISASLLWRLRIAGGRGVAYRNNRRFGNAIKKYGWDAFDSFVVAFAENRDALNDAEVSAIVAAGGHKSKFTYNLSPGGDMVAENDKPIVGIHLQTGQTREFNSGVAAARMLGFKSADNAMAVVRGELLTANGWWFRLADDMTSRPPTMWGEKLRLARMREINARPVLAVRYGTGESRRFETMDLASEQLGVQQSEVWAVAHGKSHSAKGWWFRFEDDNRSMPKTRGHKSSRLKRDIKVYATKLATGERREFRNCTVADIELEIYKGAAAMVASANERRPPVGGFHMTNPLCPRRNIRGRLLLKPDQSLLLP